MSKEKYLRRRDRWVRRYTDRNLRVLPIKAQIDGKSDSGKSPATPHGYKDAVADLRVAIRMFEDKPRANIGIATGRKSGVIVIDVDPRNGGDATLKRLVKKYGPLSKCLSGIILIPMNRL